MIAAVYCSGSIRKGPRDTAKSYWTDHERSEVSTGANPLELKFLNPDDPARDLDDSLALFGRDMYQLSIADFMVVDARERRGIGIGIEILASRMLDTPLIAVAPQNTYYRMDRLEYRGSSVENYVHPHLASLSDAIVDDFFGAGVWIRTHIERRDKAAKHSDLINAAINAYKTQLLPHDERMKQTLRNLGREVS